MSNIKNKTSSTYIKDISREYAIYTAQHRAIPSICDGLKDGQRKFLWVARNKGDKIKTVSLGSEAIGQGLYMHGDGPASDTVSMMAAPFCNNVPLFEGLGNFGTRIAPTEVGAPRYTSIKRGNAAKELIYPDINIIPLKENYDGSNMEPVNFLPLIPMVLVNGISGIAVGWSTDILPRNIGEIIDATIKTLDGKKITSIKPSYDYLNCSVEHIEGNSWIFSGRIDKVNSNTLRITELPPETTLEKYKEKLNKMIDDGTIMDYDDNSAEFIDIEIKVARKSIEGLSEKSLLEMFKLRQKKTERIVVLNFDNKSITQYDSDINLIKDFVKWRFGWYKVRYEKMKNDSNYELLYWKALKECFDKNLPSKISKMKNKSELESEVNKIVSKIVTLDDKQLDKISSLPSFRWAKDYYSTILDTIKTLEDNISYYESLLSDDTKMKDVYKEELKKLKTVKFR